MGRMQSEVEAKERTIRNLEAQINNLQYLLEEKAAENLLLTRKNEEVTEAKERVDKAIKDERREHHQNISAVKEQVVTLEQERDKLLMEAQRKETHSAEVEKLIEQRAAAQTQREEREKRVEHLANVGLRRMFQQGLAKGWTAWQEQYYAITRQKRLLQASAARLAKPKLSAAVSFWRHDWRMSTMSKERQEQVSRHGTSHHRTAKQSSLSLSHIPSVLVCD